MMQAKTITDYGNGEREQQSEQKRTNGDKKGESTHWSGE
jgi:hypothetical protein